MGLEPDDIGSIAVAFDGLARALVDFEVGVLLVVVEDVLSGHAIFFYQY